VRVAAAVSLEEALGQLLADFAQLQPAVRVRVVFGASDEFAAHLLAGAPADLFLTADEQQLNRLDAVGMVVAGSPTALVENGLAAIGRVRQPPIIRRAVDLLRPEVKSIVVAEPSSPLGRDTRDFLERHRLYETLQARLLHVDNARGVVAAVRGGRANVGLAYRSDAVYATGCQVLFTVPRSSTAIRYMGAVLRQGQQLEQAEALLRFLGSRVALTKLRRCGFLPVRSRE
jgi:molybdate transport system substrate-binding protein